MVAARFVTGVEVAAAACLFAFILSQGSGLGPVWVFLPLLAVEVFLSWFAYQVQPSDTLFIQQFDEAVFIVAVALLPAGGVVAVFGLGLALGLVFVRISPRVMLLNGGMMALSAVAGLAAVQWA